MPDDRKSARGVSTFLVFPAFSLVRRIARAADIQEKRES
ncbi:hypothetical protein C7S17_6736 [Burkholderia thailandensis]|nr:hypothetical protein [Burkholderia thailandensis]